MVLLIWCKLFGVIDIVNNVLVCDLVSEMVSEIVVSDLVSFLVSDFVSFLVSDVISFLLCDLISFVVNIIVHQIGVLICLNSYITCLKKYWVAYFGVVDSVNYGLVYEK